MTLGPVTQTLEREVASELRRQGILIWLDKDEHYRTFVDGLSTRATAGVFPHPVVSFRGSFLELLLTLEPFGSGLDKAPLLIHMPGFNEESIKATPVLELYEAGTRFRKGLDTLIRESAVGRVAPAEVDTFLAKHPTLEDADAWLASASSGRADDLLRFLEDVGQQLLVEALGGDASVLAARVSTPEALGALIQYLHRLTGLDDAWLKQFAPSATRLEAVLDATGAWLLSVEYVHDLRRPPYLPALQRLRDVGAPVAKTCRGILDQLRARFPDAYERRADQAESFVSVELQQMAAEDLGQIDTFREEEVRVLEGAISALSRGEWAKASAWCAAREGELSFWLKRDQSRRWTWNLVAEAASFGEALAAQPRPFDDLRSLDEAVEKYAAEAYAVDSAHRRFEQRLRELFEPRLAHFGDLQVVVGALRQRHRDWADQLARDFAAIGKSSGFLPSDTLQQRTLFEQVVLPMTKSSEKVAFFVVDALRFEMAAELAQDLKAGSGTVVDLKARLAELPTITSVGMNVLAPVSKAGRLQVAGTFQGFKTGEFTVNTPETRARAMGLRAVGKGCLRIALAEVGEKSTAALKKLIAPHPLILVHSTEIDDAGEANVGLTSFEATLRQLKAAWHHLQLAGVKHFVFTADHGFLLQDETTRLHEYGKKKDPRRRYVLDDHPRQERGMVPISLSSLGYEGLGGYLLVLEDTANFVTGTVGATFVHGGNSPQERVIPVLTVTRPRAEGRSAAEYVIEAEALPDAVGLHRIRVRVVFAEGSLGFVARSQIAVTIRPQERPDVTAVLRDATGPGSLSAGRVLMPVDSTWTELFFALDGPHDERVRVEVHHPDQAESVKPAALDSWFTVTGQIVLTVRAPILSSAPPEPALLTWSDGIEHEGFRRIFVHIEKHGAITEPEVTAILGSPRAFRKFSLEFDGLLAKLPFRVRVEPGDGGKRYVKEGSKS